MRKWLTILLFFTALQASAQFKDSSLFEVPLKMDEVVVKAVRGGWDVKGFMKRVKEDTTFYKAFRSMRVVNYTAINDIKVLNDKGAVKAFYYSKTKQQAANGCRTMQTLEEKVSGDFFKNGRQYRYYTAELFASLFFTEGKVCGETDIVAGALKQKGKGQIEANKYKLKQLMFNPGSKVGGVPMMGDKAQIFEPSVAKMYDFKLSSEEYNGQECYVFSAVPKRQYADDVVYDVFTTWFRKSDYAILQRDYSLSYKTMAYDFDVDMKVRMTQSGNRILPAYISYNGNWHVFSKKRERVRFTVALDY